MGNIFRLHRSGLRRKISYISVLGFTVVALVLSINVGITYSADPTFISPVPVAGGNQLYYDMNLKIRPTDGRAFIIGNKGSGIFLSVTDPNNPNNQLSVDNVANGNNGALYPTLAFTPANAPNAGVGYLAWRFKSDARGKGFEGYIRILPTNYVNGSFCNSQNCPGFFLSDFLPYKLDQPTIAVGNNGHIYVVGYYANPGNTQLLLLEFVSNGVNTLNLVNTQVIATQPATGAEMDPQMCMDNNNNINIVTLFPVGGSIRLFAMTRIDADPGDSFTQTDITSDFGYDSRAGIGRGGKDIACAPSNDGKAYIAIKRGGPNTFDFYRRPGGSGQSWGVGVTHQPNATEVFGSGKVISLAVTTSLDGRVWVARGDIEGTGPFGTYVKYSDNDGVTFLPANPGIAAVPKSQKGNVSVAMDGNGPGSKVHLAASFNTSGGLPESTFYTYANTILAPPTNLTATAVSFKQINLSWTASVSGPESYKVYRSTNPSSGFSVIASNVVGTSYSDNNLPYNSTYYYKVTAVKSGFNDSTDSNVAGATTLGPVSVVFLASPASPGQAGATNYQPTIKVVDVTGATVTNYTGTVTFSITPGTGTAGAALSGTTTQNIVAGVSSFTGTALKINSVGTNYKFRATINPIGLTADSNPFNLTGQLTVAVVGSITETTPFSVTVTVKNFATPTPATDTNYNDLVFLSFTPSSGVYFYGQTSVKAAGGVATFTNLMIDTDGAGYAFTAILPNSLGTGTQNAIPVANYTEPNGLAECTRIMYLPVNSSYSGPCTNSDLQAALNSASGRPVFVDHRTGPVGFGPGQYPLPNTPLIIPDKTWLDAGCNGDNLSPNTPWGLLVTVSETNSVTLSGGSTPTSTSFLRGINFNGFRDSGAVLTGPQGNIKMSCSRVVQNPAG